MTPYRLVLAGAAAIAFAALLWISLSGPAREPAREGAGAPANAPIAGALPSDPFVVELTGEGLQPGRRGGTLRMLLAKEKDIRLLNVWGYARLVGWTPDLKLETDLLRALEIKEGRIFTLRLRGGHKWSDGAPFTSEDFRYFWDDIANNKALSPAGPPAELLNEGDPPKVYFPDAQTIVYEYVLPNPRFLSVLAQAREPYIYRPSHYLKQFHEKYAASAQLAGLVGQAKASSWAALHNRMDSLDDADNTDLPTLQPWVVATAMPANRFQFRRNPYFHRRDVRGQQLPYIDQIDVAIVDGGLIAVKTAAGDSDLQARGLSFADMTALKQNEAKGQYRVQGWPIAKAAQVALYPNLNASDPVWRALNRDKRFRRALSLGINRDDINKSLFFGMAAAGNNAVLPTSPLYDAAASAADSAFDVATANALLDEAGLSKRDGEGVRLLSDGRKAEIVIESAGESKEETDVLTLIGEHWKALGLKLLIKSSDRAGFRARVYSGEAVMSVWAGWDNGIPTPEMSPDELAPTAQTGLAWPQWGQFYETKGASGEAPDMAEGQELLSLNAAWARALSPQERVRIWKRMIEIHTSERFVIGVISGVVQPVVVSTRLRNVPPKGLWSWDPGAQFGMYRMDQFWIEP